MGLDDEVTDVLPELSSPINRVLFAPLLNLLLSVPLNDVSVKGDPALMDPFTIGSLSRLAPIMTSPFVGVVPPP